MLPPVPVARLSSLNSGVSRTPSGANRAQPNSNNDTNSTGSTGSTERSEAHGENVKEISAKLAMDALERRDYELLALITQAAQSGHDPTDQPGGPRAPGTPINIQGSLPYSQPRRPGTSAPNGSSLEPHTGRPESAPSNRRHAQPQSRSVAATPYAHARNGDFTAQGSHSALSHGWGGNAPTEGRYMEPEDVESIVARTTQKLSSETKQVRMCLNVCVFVCVKRECMCVCVCEKRERERGGGERKKDKSGGA